MINFQNVIYIYIDLFKILISFLKIAKYARYFVDLIELILNMYFYIKAFKDNIFKTGHCWICNGYNNIKYYRFNF